MNHLAWTRFGAALEYYRHFGYQYIDVPWIAPPQYVEETLPAGKFPMMVTEGLNQRGALLGSGEQSFIWFLREKMFPPDVTRFMTITPCFRGEDDPSRMNRMSFMKLELFAYLDNAFTHEDMANHAHKFFRRWYPGAVIVNTEEGLDIMYRGVELGSYGTRRGEFFYGTGLAEPRFTLAGERRDELP